MVKTVRPKNNPEYQHTKSTVYDRLTRWFEKNHRLWIIGVLAIGLLAGLLTFDVKPSTGGDDITYILQAMDIVSTGHIPIGFRTPGYPLVLALFVWVFGVKLILLKVTSLIFFLGMIVSLFFVFRNRLQPIVLSLLLLLVALNPLMLEYAHQTYSELLFALLLIWTIHFVFRASEMESVWFTIFAAVLAMMSFYIRVVGITAAGSAVFFFAWQRRWKQLGVFIFMCIVLYSPMKIYEWTSGAATFGQASILLLKNPYNSLQGTETLSGFVERFINNIINQLNYQIPSALGLSMPQEIAGADGRFIPNAAALIGILISVVVWAGYIPQMITKPKSLLAFLGYFLFAYIAFISLVLQNLFATPRMLVPIVPYLFIGFIEGFRWLGHRWTKVKDTDILPSRVKTLVLVVLIGLTIVNLIGSKDAIDRNVPILKANLGGNELAGFTEDWTNYIRATLWIKTNLSMETTRVICRKPEFFNLYAGNYVLYGTYKIDQVHPDSIVAKWKSLKMTHLLYDNFQWSSTLRRYVEPVAEKYPQMFELVYQEGTQFPSYIFRLNYSAVTDSAMRQRISPMNIVLIGPAYPIRGGNALFIAHLYEALSATNDVHVISFSRLYPAFIFPGIRQIDISNVAMKKHSAVHIIDCLNPFTWWKAARLAASINPDMLVFTWWNPFFGILVRTIALGFKRRTKKPVVIIAENIISHEGRWIDLFLTKIALQTANRFLVLSGVVEENIKKLFPAIKVFRSSLPIYDCYQTTEQLTQQQAQQRLGLEGKNILLFFGYVRKYKGLMNLLEALPLILEKVRNVHLLIVGEFYDDPQPYLNAIQRLGLDKNITIMNEYVANETVHLYFTAANLAVLPYNEATQSGILSIAYGFAKPVVVTNVGGLAELVDDGGTGMYPPHDITKLADAIIRYLKDGHEQVFSRNIDAKKQENSFHNIRNVFDKIQTDQKP